MQALKASIICPECTRKQSRLVHYIEETLFKGEPFQTHSFWCIRCDARIEITFTIKKKNESYKLDTVTLISNGKKLNKKLKLESPNNGKKASSS